MFLYWTPDQTLQELEIQAVIGALDYYKWNRTRAAKSLGISIRGLRNKINKMREMGLMVPSNPRQKTPSVCWLPRISKYGY